METSTRARVLTIIRNITSIPGERIGERTSLRRELNVDSLSMLEIGVDVGYEFRLDVSDEYFRDADTLEQLLALIDRAPRKAAEAS